MNLKALKNGAINTLEYENKLAEAGKEFSVGTIMDCKRVIWLVDNVATALTEEEWNRIQEGILGIRDRETLTSNCKDIKEKYDISWNELEMLRISGGLDDVKALNTSSQTKASMKYDKANTKQITFKFNLNTDADILEKLASVPNKQGYIKELIRKDLKS